MKDLSIYREDFPILKRKINNNDLIFFDNGATTQKPIQVIDAISDYYKNYNYDKAMKIYKIGDLGLGNKEFIKGSPDRTTTICSHFCFKVIRFIVRNYYKDYDLLNYRVEEIENHYREKLEYITPGHLYNVIRQHTQVFG